MDSFQTMIRNPARADIMAGNVPDVRGLYRRCEEMLFTGLWMFIIIVSVHDGYLVLANRCVMQEAEQNPFGRWLIQINGGDIWLLLFVKAAGTILVGMLLLLLRAGLPRVAFAVCLAVAIFQLLLLCWLYQP